MYIFRLAAIIEMVRPSHGTSNPINRIGINNNAAANNTQYSLLQVSLICITYMKLFYIQS